MSLFASCNDCIVGVVVAFDIADSTSLSLYLSLSLFYLYLSLSLSLFSISLCLSFPLFTYVVNMLAVVD